MCRVGGGDRSRRHDRSGLECSAVSHVGGHRYYGGVPTEDGDKNGQPTSFRVLAAHPNIVVGINTSAFYSYTVWVLLAGLLAASVRGSAASPGSLARSGSWATPNANRRARGDTRGGAPRLLPFDHT
jgi:hypothetical protein